ncbi:hypoxanthine phosphoribosyltransferase [Candidatus Woesearchaeota archaeon CG_4_10_14_0_2_um_filter_57_5]|nr:MAG: hypothetical protein AUJ68_03720 [Candidatus Woesearchaeota archaeon CG1_02_57_44]PIN69847.1 MAG: hypoxanthine phosphoribosyltransferase [Candidatus Woesearchaeota archaeon CG11_big_fil_rev_8_21_14_0_20_57_5]PIZ48499.1 MAG: hypoxanthine phosphoribosyltransferase [Candidatus Woesearchaeota archaeon CG_4_10_14_0_2_um_filter_57_5]
MKHFVRCDELLLDSMRLARKVWNSGYRPTYLLALWRGGTPIGVCVHEFFKRKGESMNHLAIKAESYLVKNGGKDNEIVQLGPMNIKICPGDRLLIVDDVYASGAQIERLLDVLRERVKLKDVEARIAVLYHKPQDNGATPDYFLHETQDFIVFPHELTQMNDAELGEHEPEVAQLLHGD